MLDTRKIEYFVKPQSLIEILNKDMGEMTFHDWGKRSVNFVMSTLLKNHIKGVVNDKHNLSKLRDTMRKIGLPEIGSQMLVLDAENGHLILYESLGDNRLLVSSSRIHPAGHWYFNIGTILNMFPDIEKLESGTLIASGGGSWFISEDVFLSTRFKDIPDEEMQNYTSGVLTALSAFYIYLTLIEVETVEVAPKEKFKAKKYAGFKNMQQVPIRVADLSWARETINNLPFGVVGHLRNQPVGPGRRERKLIYIEPFMKQGLVRKSGKERILKIT